MMLSKQGWIKIGAGSVVLGILVFAGLRSGGLSNIFAVISETPSPSPEAEDIAEAIKRVEAGQPPRIEEGSSEADIYNNPFIKHIRIALQGYMDGSNRGIDDPEYIISGPSNMPNCGLKKFDKAYYKSKFILLNAGDNDYGGVQADIVFIDKPDKIFWAWVYQLGGSGEYTLRGFCSNGPNGDLREEFQEYIKGIIEESNFFL